MTFLNLNVIAAVLAMMIYVTIAVLQLRGKMTGLNFATYLLWCLLDTIAAASLFIKGGEWTLPAAYAVGCVIVMVPLVLTRSFSWARLDTFITVMVAISIVVWFFVGPTAATIVSTAGVVLACVPQAWEIIRRPQNAVVWIYVGYTTTNSLSLLAGKDWSIQERFYSGCCTAATLVILLLALRKFAKPIAIA